MKSSISTLQKSAMQFAEKGEYDKAIASWKKIVTVREDANIYNTIGDLYIKKGSKNDAVEYFILAANKFRSDGFYEKAMAIYKKTLNIVPFQYSALIALAELYAEKGLISNAVTYYTKAAEKISRDGKIDKTIDIYSTILELTPSDIKIKTKLADLWLSKGLPEKAANDYASVAVDYMNKEDFDTSVEFFSKAIGLDSKNVPSFIGLSDLAAKQDKLDEAFDFADKALQFSNNNKDILSKFIQIAIRANRLHDAKDVVSKLRASHPADLLYKKLLGNIYIIEGQLDQAWEELQPCIDELLQNQNWDEARALLEQFEDVSSTPVKLRLATLYRNKNDIGSLTDVLKDLAKIYEEQGEAQNVIVYYKELAGLEPDNVFFKEKVDEIEKSLGAHVPTTQKGPLPPEEKISIDEETLAPPQDDFKDSEEVNEKSFLAGSDEEDYESHYAAGIEYRQNGLLDDAIREFQIAAQDPERRVLTSRMIASCYMEKNEFSLAIDKFNGILEAMSPDETNYLRIKYELAEAYMRSDNTDKALEIYIEIHERDPEFRDVSDKIRTLKEVFNTPEDTVLQGEDISAEGAVDEAPQNNYQEKLTEAEFFATQGLIDEAISIYEELLTLKPDNPEVQKQIQSLRSVLTAGTSESADQYTGTETAPSGDNISVSEKSLEPADIEEDYESHYMAGIEYRQNGLFDDAIREFQIAAQDPEKRVLTLRMIASCYMEKNEYSLAIDEFNRILETMSPDETNYLRIKYELAEAYMLSDNTDKAIDIYIEIHERDPEFRDVSDKIRTLKEDFNTPEDTVLQEEDISAEGAVDEAPQDNYQETQKHIHSLRSEPTANTSGPADQYTETETASSGGNVPVSEKPLESAGAEEDYEAHYTAGTEYKKKGLLDDAIREFQIAAKDPERRVLTSRMIDSCYMEKNLEFLDPFISSMLNVLSTMAKIKANAGKPVFKKDEVAQGDVSGFIEMSGQRARVTLAISFTEPVIKEITKRILGVGETNVNDYTADTVGEITNILTGGGRKILGEKGYKFNMAIPAVSSGKNHIISHRSKTPVIIVPFATDAGKFFIELSVDALKLAPGSSDINQKASKKRISYI